MGDDSVPATLTAELSAAVEELRPELLRLGADVVRIPSVSPTFVGETYTAASTGELKVVQRFAQSAEAAGLKTDVWEEMPGRGNLAAVWPAAAPGGRSLILNGHVDTVPPGDTRRWRGGNPFSGDVADGWLYGSGACDMKGPLAAAFIAIRALRKAGVRLKGDLIFEAVTGEEMQEAHLGTTATVRRGYRADAAIVVEPTNLEVVPAGPSLLRFRLTAFGKACHSTARHRFVHPSADEEPIGVNAVEKAVFFINRLQELEQHWGHTKHHPLFAPGQFSIHPGLIWVPPESTTMPAIVADQCVVDYAIRFPPDRDLEVEKKEVEDYILTAAQLDPWLKAHPPKVEWYFCWPGANLDPEHPIVTTLARAHEAALDRPAPVTAFPAGTDATYLLKEGIPAVVYGAGDLAHAHAVDEKVSVVQLVAEAKTLALAAAAWCGVA